MDNERPPLQITDTTLRDAHQSLLATRMRIDDMLPICSTLDDIGFFSLEMWGGATFDSCIRFLNEDPWERLRNIRKAAPKTKLQMLLRGQNILGYRHYADDVVEKFVDRATENGIDIFRIFDALNDVRNLETAIKAVKRNKKHAQGTISYTISPVHNNELFVELGKRLQDMGVDSIAIKDMAGLLSPEPAYQLITTLKQKLNVPIQLHTHCTSGFALMTVVRAVEAGIDVIDCATSSLSQGTSQPPTETLVAAYKNTPADTGYDLEKLAEIAKYFTNIRKNYKDFESRFTGVDTNVLSFQLPGGMMSNLESQLKEQGQDEKIDQVLEEVPKVREDLGYPPLVTPTSQIVGTQAVMNIIAGERYKIITKETREYVKGNYGQPQGKVNPDLIKKVCGDTPPITQRPADLIEPEFEKMKNDMKDLAKNDEDVLICALFPGPGKSFLENKGKPAPQPAPAKPEPKPQQQPASATGGRPVGDINADDYGVFEVVVNNTAYDVKVKQMSDMPPAVEVRQIQRRPRVLQTDDIPVQQPTVHVSAPALPPAPSPAPEPAKKDKKAGKTIQTDISGKVLEILVKPGDSIEVNQPVVKMEAMKMEVEVVAKEAGTVASILCEVGNTVQTGDSLIGME